MGRLLARAHHIRSIASLTVEPTVVNKSLSQSFDLTLQPVQQLMAQLDVRYRVIILHIGGVRFQRPVEHPSDL